MSNNFFENYLSDPNQIKVLNKMYEGVFKLLQHNIDEVDSMINLSKVPTYRKIPFQMIQTTDAYYTLHELLNKDIVSSTLGFEIDESFESKKSKWNLLSANEKAAIADSAGYSILLTGMSFIKRSEHLNNIKFNIIKFDLYDKENRLLIRNVDYVFRENKIILIKELDEKNFIRDNSLILRDVIIDCNVSEDLIGTKMKINYSSDLTKNYYNTAMKAFTKASSGGPTVNSLSKSLSSHNIMKGISIYDKWNAPKTKKRFWNTYAENGLTEFDFMVSLPLSFIYNTDKLNVIEQFFKNIKPAYTNFIFSPSLEVGDDVKDTLDLKKDNPKVDLSTGFDEKLTLYERGKDLYKQADGEEYFDKEILVTEGIDLVNKVTTPLDGLSVKGEAFDYSAYGYINEPITYTSREVKKIAFITNEIMDVIDIETAEKIIDSEFNYMDIILMYDIKRLINKLIVKEVLPVKNEKITSEIKADVNDVIKGTEKNVLIQKISVSDTNNLPQELDGDFFIEADTGYVLDGSQLTDKLNSTSQYDKINLLVSNCKIIKLLVTEKIEGNDSVEISEKDF